MNKFSKARLLRLPSLIVPLILISFLFVRCDNGSNSVGPSEPGALATLTITPGPVSLAIGATQQFVVVGMDADSNVVAVTATWSVVAGGGTISSLGMFTAGSVNGIYTNTVKATSGSISTTVTVNVNIGALASITVSPHPDTLAVGGTQTFTAVGKDASGNAVSITPTWSVVASGGTINSSGLFTAGATPGTFTNTVQATSGAISGTATVVVTATTSVLTSITITPNPALSMATGSTQQFLAIGKDASGNTVSMTPTWSVEAGGGTINATSGLFTAGTVGGTYANTVKATSGSISGTVSVTVSTGALASISITPNSVSSITAGSTQQFTAVGKDASGNNITLSPAWSVVAGGGTIDATTGVFTAGTTPGTFTNTIRATIGGFVDVVSVTVTAATNTGALASLTITPTSATLSSGGAQTFTVVGKDASGNTVSITPSWSMVSGGGTIDATTGVFTAGTTPGTFTNTVRASSGSISSTATVIVNTGTSALASIAITPNPVALSTGGTQTFTAVGKDASGNTVSITPTWSVVAGGGTINSSGLFTAGTTPGTFTNTVTATSGSLSSTATVTVTVSNSVLASITVTPDPDTLDTGGTRQFVAVGKDASGNVITFTPSWSVVANGGTINGSGLFTAGFVSGTYTNTVRAFSGSISDSATVLVISTGPAIVNLGTAGNFVVLSKSAISTTGNTSVVGDMGVSPAAASFITGFTLSTPPTTFTTSPLVTGQVFASDYNTPTPSNLTTAISDMETAFTDAAGRTTPDFTELGAGDVTGMNLVPGLYKWGTGVNISAGGVTLTGGANAVWIFQIDQDLTVANAAIVTLSGGAQAKNIFWQVAGQVTLGTTVDFKGNILSQTLISFNTGAVLKGRALAQTAVTLNATTVTKP